MDQSFECDVIIKSEPNNEDQNLLLTYKCHICEKSFKSQRVRSKHIKTLHEDISYDIMIKKEPKIEDLPLSNFEFEGTTTDTITNLTASEIINLKIKPFKCEDCDYSSSRKGQLISEGNFGAFKSPPNNDPIFSRISASKMGQIKKGTLLYQIINNH